VIEEGASKRLLWIVGALFGYAAASEYVLAPIVAGLVIWAIVRTRWVGLLFRVVVGASPWIIATATYNVIAFGTPLPVGYRYSIFGLPAGSLFGLVPPSWESIYGITFSPYRGLFLLSPFLLLAPIGLYRMTRDPRTRDLAIVLAIVSIALLAYNASYWVWDGGGAIGPRLLVPMLPFLCLPIVVVLDSATRRWQQVVIWLLILVSAAEVWAQYLAGNNFPPDSVLQPLIDYALPLLGRSEVRFNIGNLAGLRGFATLIPLAPLLLAIVLVTPRVERFWITRRSIERRRGPERASPDVR
jgi:hypothetical protein